MIRNNRSLLYVLLTTLMAMATQTACERKDAAMIQAQSSAPGAEQGTPTQGEQAVAKTALEFSELLAGFVTRGPSETKSWAFLAEPGTPIDWKHAGIADDGTRTGDVVLTINGKPTHTVLEKTVMPAKWLVRLSGPHAGVGRLDVETQSNDGYGEVKDALLPYLQEKGFQLTPVKCLDEPASAGNTLYRLQYQDTPSAFMLHEWSCGSGGCSTNLRIYLFEDGVGDVECLGDMLPPT